MSITSFKGLFELAPYQGEGSPPSEISIWLDTLPWEDVEAPMVQDNTRRDQFYTCSWGGNALRQFMHLLIPNHNRDSLSNNKLGAQFSRTVVDFDIMWNSSVHQEDGDGSVMDVNSDEGATDSEEMLNMEEHFYFQCQWRPEQVFTGSLSFYLRLTFVGNQPQLQRIPMAGSNLTLDEYHP